MARNAMDLARKEALDRPVQHSLIWDGKPVVTGQQADGLPGRNGWVMAASRWITGQQPSGFDSNPNSADRLLKWPHSLYRPALPKENRGKALPRAALQPALLGRRQVVRQWILIPPCGGSNPPAPASQSLS